MKSKSHRVVVLSNQKNATSGKRRAQTPPSVTQTFTEIVAAAIEGQTLTEEQRSELKALLGLEGYCKRALGCDEQVRRALKPHLMAILRREMEGGFSGRTLVRIEVSDDCGLSPIAAPQLRIKAIGDRSIKMLKEAGFEGLTTVRVQPYRTEASATATMMLVRGRALGFAPLGNTAEQLQNCLRRRPTVAISQVPNIQVTAVEADCLEAALDLFLNLPSKAVSLRTDDRGARRWSPVEVFSAVEAWAELEAAAAIPLHYLVAGAGRFGRLWAAELKSKVSAAQRARVETGLVLSANFDEWATFANARHSAGLPGLSVRSDVGMPLPPAVAKPKGKIQLKKLHKTFKSKKRMRGASAPVPSSTSDNA